MPPRSFRTDCSVEFFSATSFLPAAAEFGAAREPADPLAAALLVLCASGSVCGDAACFGIVTHLIDVCAQAGVEGAPVVLALSAWACGFCVWGYHMFCHRAESYAHWFFGAGGFAEFRRCFLLASWLGRCGMGGAAQHRDAVHDPDLSRCSSPAGFFGMFLARHDLARAGVQRGVCHRPSTWSWASQPRSSYSAALFFWFPKLFWLRLERRAREIAFWMTFAGCTHFHAIALGGITDAVPCAGRKSSERQLRRGASIRYICDAGNRLHRFRANTLRHQLCTACAS